MPVGREGGTSSEVTLSALITVQTGVVTGFGLDNGAQNATLLPLTTNQTGTVTGYGTRLGVASITLGALTTGYVGIVPYQGDGWAELDALTSAQFGTAFFAGISGVQEVTLGTLTLNQTATRPGAPRSGAQSITLGALSRSGRGAVTGYGLDTASQNVALGRLRSRAKGRSNVFWQGTSSVALSPLVSSQVGASNITAARASVVLGALTQGTLAVAKACGTSVQFLGVEAAQRGVVKVRGASDARLEALTRYALGGLPFDHGAPCVFLTSTRQEMRVT